MALTANGFRLGSGPVRFLGSGGTLATSFAADIGTNRKHGSSRNLYAGDAGISAKASQPIGYLSPVAWVLAPVGGGMSSIGRIRGVGSASATGSAGRNLEAALTGASTVAGDAVAIANLIAALTGTGSISATATAVAQLTAALAGTGSVSGSAGAIANLTATIAGAATVAAQQRALAHLSADITVGEATTLTADEIAATVWATVIESGYSADDVLRLIAAAVAGKLSGADGTTITIRDITDAEDRIVATVDENGNRSAVTLTP